MKNFWLALAAISTTLVSTEMTWARSFYRTEIGVKVFHNQAGQAPQAVGNQSVALEFSDDLAFCELSSPAWDKAYACTFGKTDNSAWSKNTLLLPKNAQIAVLR